MKLLRQYYPVIIIITIVVALVCYKALNHNVFRYDAVKHAAASISGGNQISSDQLAKLDNEILIINLDGTEMNINTGYSQLSISSDSILVSPDKKLIFKHKGSIVLNSADKSKAAAIWMVLSQMGVDDLYVLE